MTRILVQRGSAGSSSSSSQNRSSTSSPLPSSSSSSFLPAQAQNASNSEVVLVAKDDEGEEEVQEQLVVDEFSENSSASGNNGLKCDDLSPESGRSDQNDDAGATEIEKDSNDDVVDSGNLVSGFAGLTVVDEENEELIGCSSPTMSGSSCPPPPPVPPPKVSSGNSNLRRSNSSKSNAAWVGSSRRGTLWSTVSTRTSPTESRPSSPRYHSETEGYNSADEQGPCFGPSYDDAERERQFEIDIRRVKGWEVKKMLGDGNCLFRAVADQVYGDSEQYDLVRQMCVHYMEQERNHFSQFVTEGFTSYCQRKRRDKVYGNNVEIQAVAEMYNRPIHIFSYGTEPINTFHGAYGTDVPPIRLSYHYGNHYNSLVDPRRLTIGAGLGFSCLRGTNINRDQVKAAIKAHQDELINKALLAEGQLYSDLELTEKEIERMAMEASKIEYLANVKFTQQLDRRDSSTSGAEPSSSGARPSGSENHQDWSNEFGLQDSVLSGSMQIVLSMGFSYMQAVEAYSIFGDDVDSMICYLLETSSSTSNRRKGKATQ